MDTIETSPSKPSPAAPPPAKVVIVDIGERQSPEEIKSLRKGEGQLIDRVERIMADLTAAGTVAGSVQPVVFVVRETYLPDDDDDDDDDEDGI